MKKNIFMKLIFTAVLFFATYTSLLSAAEVDSVSFEQHSNYKFSEKMLRLNVQLKKGSKFDENTLNDDIKRLYSTGFFTDIVSETTANSDGSVNIIFKITPKSRIKSVIIEGNKKFTTETLKEEISLVPEVPLSDKKLRNSAVALRKFYRSEGYNDATITPKVIVLDKDTVKVIFKIDENLRLRVGDVIFTGNSVYSSWTLRHSIANQYSFFSWLLDIGLLNRTELKNDKLRIRELYWNKGFLDFKIKKVDLTQESGSAEYVDIHFILDEGTAYKVGKVSVSGNKKFTSEKLMKSVSFKRGEIYDNRIERQDINSISANYYKLGYSDFTCRTIRLPNYETHTVDIEYRIQEGEQYRVRDIRVVGNKITKDYVIRRELVIQPGDPVDPNRVEISKSRLMGLGYFKDVSAVTIKSGQQGMKNVDFAVEEKETAHFKIGGGFSDTANLVGMVSISQTNFDLFDPENYFAGGGQRVRLQGSFGIDRYNFEADFTEPWLFDTPLRLDLSGYLRNIDYENWSVRRFGGKGSLTRKFYDDFTSASFGYRFEHVRVYEMDNDLKYTLDDEVGSSRVSAVALSLVRDTRDSFIEPTSGYEMSILGEITSKVLGASENYYRTEAKASHYFNFLDKALILHVGAKVGMVDTLAHTKNVPLYERYFLGGGESLRGFPYRGVSPVDPRHDDPIGGKGMYLASVELTHPIWDFIRGAIFIDAGNVTSGAGIHQMDEVNAGAGYGLRIKLPHVQTPVKLDLAYPFRNRQKGLKSKLRFHFSMGFSW